MVKTHVEESLGANPGDAALNPADSVAMGIPSSATTQRGSPGTFTALRSTAFRLLFISFLINQIGFWISHISLQGVMVELSNNDTRQNGLLFFVLFLPMFVLAPLAGLAADRFDRKKIILFCYGGVIATCVLLAWMTIGDWLTPTSLLTAAFCMGVSFAFSSPASLAIAANSVPIAHLPSAISLQSAANNLTRVVGPLLAAPLVASSQFGYSFALYGVAATIAAVLTAFMRFDRFLPEKEEGGIFSRMASGFVHARERHPTLPALLMVAVLSYFGVSHMVLLPAYAQDVLGSRDYFALLAASAGLGAMVGALFAGRAGTAPSLVRTSLSLVGYGAMLFVFGFFKVLSIALLAQVMIGFFYFSIMTRLQTLIQQRVGEALRGRVMSLFQVCWAGLIPFGTLTLGYLAKPLGVGGTLIFSSLICAGYGLAMTWITLRWRAQARDNGPPTP